PRKKAILAEEESASDESIIGGLSAEEQAQERARRCSTSPSPHLAQTIGPVDAASCGSALSRVCWVSCRSSPRDHSSDRAAGGPTNCRCAGIPRNPLVCVDARREPGRDANRLGLDEAQSC